MKNSDDSGYTGKHVGVCVLDTGIFPHIDFTGEYLRFKISSDIVSDLMMIILMEPMYVGSLAVTEGLRKDGSEELPRVVGLSF